MIQAEAILTKEHRERGFYLEDDEDFVYLKYSGKTVAKWNGRRVEETEILAEANKLSCEDFWRYGVYACDSCQEKDCWSGGKDE